MGSIPGQGTKIPHALEQLSLHTKIRKSEGCSDKDSTWDKISVLQLKPDAAKQINKRKLKVILRITLSLQIW